MRLTYERVFGIFGALLIVLFVYVTYQEEHPSWMAVQKRMYAKAYKRVKAAAANAKTPAEVKKYAGLEKVYSHPRIELKQIILRTLEVERCGTCHVDDDELHEKHGDIFSDFPTEIYGCAVCHGGDGRSTEEKSAHYGLLRNRDEMVQAALYAESPCAFCHVDKQDYLTAHPSAGGLDAGIMLNCTTCHVHKDDPKVQKLVLPHLAFRVNKEERSKVHIAFSAETPKTRMYAFWRRMRELTPPSSDPVLSPPPTFREFNITGDLLQYRGSQVCLTCHLNLVRYSPSTFEHTHFFLKSKFRTFEIVKKQPDYITPPPTYPLDPVYGKSDQDLKEQCLDRRSGRPSWCPRPVTPDQYRQTCWQCHTTGFDSRTQTYVEEGVTCEACHGPGEYFTTLMTMGLGNFLAEQDRKLKHLHWQEEMNQLKSQLGQAQNAKNQAEMDRLNALIREKEKEETVSVFTSAEYTDIEGNTRVAYMGTFYAQSGATISRIADDRNVCLKCHVANYHEMRPEDLETKRLEERPGKGYQAIALGP